MFYITEDEVDRNLKMEEVVDALQETFVHYGEGKAMASARDRLILDGTVYNTMPAIDSQLGIAGMKTYIAGKNGAKFVVVIFDQRKDELLAIIDANRLGQIRTGALPAMASRILVKGKKHNLAIIGSGFQAQTQIQGMLSQFDVDMVKVYSRNYSHAKKFADEMSRKFGVDVRAEETARSALKDITLVNSITDSNQAIFSRSDLGDEYHVNLCGGNIPMRQEAADDVLSESDLVVTEHLEQSLKESGEMIHFVKNSGGKPVELKDLVVNREKYYGKQRTVFKTMGIGLEDIATGYLLLKKMNLI
ncbi:ornithine cyclodeaminase [Oxyplasma meridianum]|uniref:Ornithine cyclodeaminase n=1 Tax=Oxyplasma meridianum TaxID=3073602 RepID=A0AAX4NFU6_9ARCH